MMFDAINFVGEVQRKYGAGRTYRMAQKFMLNYLMSIRDLLPIVVNKSLEVAARFLIGEASRQELDAARVACWQFLDDKQASVEFTQPENCAVRAAICLLYADATDNDIAGLVEWFLELANGVKDQSDILESMMRKDFSVE